MGRGKTVEINGRKYDAATGKLIKKSPTSARSGSIDGVVKAKPASQLHSAPKRSKTLNRAAVAKPKLEKKSASPKKTIHRAAQSKSQAHKVDDKRQKRAKEVSKSSLISKFSKQKEDTPKEAKKQEAIAPAQPVSLPKKTNQSNYSPKQSNKEKKQKEKKKTRRFTLFSNKPKAASVFASALVFVLFAGYVTYLNIPNMSLKIAASRAGIDATMPGYKPAGYSIAGPINYSEGLVTISFQSNSDERSFNITERESSWDSESLQANYVERETPNYVTFQDRGLTIYIYDGSNATWVDGGIWYTIEGDSFLDSDQLLKIAASM